MKKQLQCFILWENSRYIEQELIDEIRRNFTIIKIYEVDWGKYFVKNLTRLYGKNVLRMHKKEKESGTGKFLFIPVFDEHPIIKNGKSVNTGQTKHTLRQMTKERGRFLAHASDCEAEADMNMRFILGIGAKEFITQNQELVDNTNYIPLTGMLAQNGWKSKKQLLDFIKTLPNVKIISEKTLQIQTDDKDLLLRLINGKKPLIRLNRRTYKVSIGKKSQKIEIIKEK